MRNKFIKRTVSEVIQLNKETRDNMILMIDEENVNDNDNKNPSPLSVGEQNVPRHGEGF